MDLGGKTPYIRMARKLRWAALAHEVFDDKEGAKKLRRDAKLYDNLQKFHEEYIKKRDDNK